MMCGVVRGGEGCKVYQLVTTTGWSRISTHHPWSSPTRLLSWAHQKGHLTMSS